MAAKIKPGSKAFLFVAAAFAVSVLMALSSLSGTKAIPMEDMVTAAPSGDFVMDELLPNCIRCGGTDSVLWLPMGVKVTEEGASGSVDGISYAVFLSDSFLFDDSLRENILASMLSFVPGTGRKSAVTGSSEGYLGREKARYEEMSMRGKVSLHTRSGYVFSYLLQTGSGEAVVITSSCEGTEDVPKARDLAKRIGLSFQRGTDQDEEVRRAVYDAAQAALASGEEATAQEDGGEAVNYLLSLDQGGETGSVLVVTWKNASVRPGELAAVSPGTRVLPEEEEQAGRGRAVFYRTEAEDAGEWEIVGISKDELTGISGRILSRSEFEEEFWN